MDGEVAVLVDWQNCFHGRGFKTLEDAEDALSELTDLVQTSLNLVNGRPTSVEVRLYGSWSIEPFSWRLDPFSQKLESALARTSRRIKGAATVFDLVRGMAHASEVPDPVQLCAYVSERDCRKAFCSEKIYEQKLADTMLTSDAAFYGSFTGLNIVLISNDNDMIPGLLTSSYFRRGAGGRPAQEILWYRPGRPRMFQDSRLEKHFRVEGRTR